MTGPLLPESELRQPERRVNDLLATCAAGRKAATIKASAVKTANLLIEFTGSLPSPTHL
jgi:hypothetical protein